MTRYGFFILIALLAHSAHANITWQAPQCHQQTAKGAGTWAWLCEQAGTLNLTQTPTTITIQANPDYSERYIQYGNEVLFKKDNDNMAFSLQVGGMHLKSQETQTITPNQSLPIYVRFFASEPQSGQTYHFASGTIATLSVASPQGNKQDFAITTETITTNPTINTCQITATQTTINLPAISIGDLSTGTVSQKTPLTLPLIKECPSNTKVYASLTDSNDWANTSTILKNTGTAQGVGLSLYRNQNVLQLGRPPAPTSYTNQPNVVPLDSQGKLDSVSVGYVKTDNVVNAGTINSAVLISFYYQ